MEKRKSRKSRKRKGLRPPGRPNQGLETRPCVPMTIEMRAEIDRARGDVPLAAWIREAISGWLRKRS